MPQLAHLGHRGHHGKHQPDLSVAGSTQDRAHLRLEHLGERAVQPCAAHAEERILLGSDAEIRRRLVPADVERPDHHGLAEAGARKRVEVELLVLAGGIGPVEKQELRAQQADAVRGSGHGTLDVVAGSHVGGHLHPMLAESHAGASEPVGGGDRGIECLAACREVGDRRLGRADDDVACRAVDGDWVACSRALDDAGGAHHRRHAQRSGDDGDVRGRPACLGHETEHGSGVERGGVGRRELFRNEHRRLSDLPQVGHFDPGQPSADPVGDLDHVLSARRDVRIVDRREHVFDLLARLLQRCVEPGAFAESSGDGIGEHRVLGHQCLGFEDVAGFGASRLSCRLAHRRELSAHCRARLAERSGGVGHVRHHDGLGVDDDCRPDGHARRSRSRRQPGLGGAAHRLSSRSVSTSYRQAPPTSVMLAVTVSRASVSTTVSSDTS